MRSALAVPRALHPAAWWVWALGLATAVSQTTNPLLVLLAFGVAAFVVAARRGHWPWARAFGLYVRLGLFIIVVRVVLHILVGLKLGDIVILPLPSIALPSWAAGINLGGSVRLDGLIAAVVEALRLATMIACIGAANALANPKRLLKSMPSALREIGTAVVVAITVAPQLAQSVQRVRRARALRGDTRKGLRAVPAVALPVLEDTLERSLRLAAAMDSRGHGRSRGTGAHRTASAVNLAALLAVAVGLYGVLDSTTSAWMGLPALLLGVALAALGLWLGGRGDTRTTYRPDPWRMPEWLTVACGAAAATGMVLTARWEPSALVQPILPLGLPGLPALAVTGLLVAALPAFLTPPHPVPSARLTRRGTVVT
ncbi:MAG: energy-coupling factor transporter transmembrane component T [Dermatophilaceae bacterium]